MSNTKQNVSLSIIILLFIFPLFATAQIVRVNINSPCAAGCDGSSWALAYPSLKAALNATSAGEIWVAQGTYTPHATSRDSVFVLKNNLALYGGFNGTETTSNQRNINTNLTILSGDLSNNDGANFANFSENSYHVVKAKNVNSTAILDGFTIRGGNANAAAFPNYIGGGFFNDGSNGGTSTPIVQNCHFTENFADRSGGGIYNYAGANGHANMTILNCRFTLNKADEGAGLYNDGQSLGTASPTVEGCFFGGNTALVNGGGICNYGGAVGTSSPTIVNCVISGNLAVRGGGMYNNGSSVGNANGLIINCTFSGNEGTTEGSAVFNFGGFSGNCSPVFTNCVFYNNTTSTIIGSIQNSDATPFLNYCLVQEATCPGINTTCDANTIFNQNPQFTTPITAAAPTITGDLTFVPCSPLRDAGDNATINGTGFSFDYQDSIRIYTNTVDIGAYEYNGSPAELSANAIISSNYNGSPISCAGVADAAIDLTITNGVLPYTFAWDNGIGATEDPTGLSAGTYIVTVSDALGCTAADTVIIANPAIIQTSIAVTSNYNGTNISCANANDGAVNLTAMGGTGSYTFLWSVGGLTIEDPTTLTGGTHYVTVTDQNGCFALDTVTLSEPSALTATAAVSSDFNGFDVSCVGANDGAIDLTVNGGVAPYTFNWSGGLANIEDPNTVAAGTYTVTVTDANGCSNTANITLNPPTVLIANLGISSNFNGANISCAGAADGAINLSPSGGASPYTFNWDNGAGTNEDPTNLATNTYTVTLTDANNCQTTNSITISEPTPLTASAVVSSNFNGQQISCNGGNDGAINLTAAGGTGILTFNWNNGAGTNEDPTNLAANTYTVTVTDANGCLITTSATLTEPTPVTANAVITTNYNGSAVSCAGANDGAADATGGGGVAPYTYFWNNGIGAIEDPIALDTGTYIVTVTDLNGCIATTNVTLSSPAGLDLTLAVSSNYNGSDVSCVGANDGAIDLTVNGGIAPYLFNWSGGLANMEDPNAVAAGTYTVTVTDANGCTNTGNITLNPPTVLIANLGISSNFNGANISCAGAADGAINLSPSGGASPYTFNWDNGAGTNEDPTNLAANTYTVTLTDANNCQTTNSITISEPTALTASAVASSNFNGQQISCNGGNDGAINLTAAGGTGILTFNWNNGAGTNEDPTNLAANTYTVTVTDANGCLITTSATLTEPTPVTANAVITTNYNGSAVSCAGANDGAADATGGGGVAPYTYFWNNGIGAIEAPITLDTGTYIVTVTDLNGCIATASVTLSGPAGLDLTLAVSSNYNSSDVSCVGANDGSINLTVSGGNLPYVFNWDNGIGNTEDPNALTAGTYRVTVTDNNGCPARDSITLNDPVPLVAIAAESNPISCPGDNDGAINLTVSGGATPYSFLWDNSAGTNEDPTNLAAGTYNVTATDANSCTQTAALTLNDPVPLAANAVASSVFNGFNVSCNNGNNGAIDLTASGGTGVLSYLWDNGAGTNADPTNLAAGTYNVTVTDTKNCTTTATATLTEPTALTASAVVTSNYNGVNVSCLGANDGSADLTAGGGVGGYTFLWGNGSVLEDPIDLDTGLVQVTVTDLNGCTITTSVTLSAPAALNIGAAVVSNYNGFNVSCVGANDGAIDLTAAGGTGALSIFWDNGIGNIEDPSGLVANTYEALVTDDNGCQDSVTVMVLDPTPIVLTFAEDTAIACFGGNNGAIDLTVSGGAMPFTFLWDNGAGTNEDPSNLATGTYHVTVTDANLCTKIDSFTLTEPTLLTAMAVADSVYNGFEISCFGGNNGAIDLSVNGGTMPYQYLWSNGDTLQNPDTLTAGIYTITVTDKNGCTATASVTMNEPLALTAASVATNTLCWGVNDGTIDLTVSGGTGVLSFLWDNGAGTNEDPTNLAAGIYNVLITDENNCTQTLADTLTQGNTPYSLTGIVSSNYNGNDISCPTATDGSIDLTLSPVGVYTFAWSGGLPNTEDPNGLAAGIYTVTTTDTSGCLDTASFTLNAPLAMITGISIVSNYNGATISCNGSADGSADLTITNGIAPYTFLWSNASILEDPTDLSSGTNYVTITDLNGCSVTDSIVFVAPSPVSATAVVSSNYNGNDVSCLNAADGSIDLTVSGGTGGYTFLWDNGAGTNEDPANLAAGTYKVIVTDSNGCSDSTTVTLNNPINPVSVTANAAFAGVCENAQNGIISLTVTGGAGGYSYQWSGLLPNTQNQTNLAAGTYFVTVTDGNNCTATDSIILDTLPNPMVDFSADTVCTGLLTSFFDNSITVAGSTYAWDFDGDGTIDDNTVGSVGFQYAASGIYPATLTISTPDGCKADTTINVLVGSLSVAINGLAAEYCGNADAVQLIGTPTGGTFSGDGVIGDFFYPTQAAVGTVAITYTYSNNIGCSETTTLNTQVLSVPGVEAGDDITAFANEPIDLQAIGAVSYIWSPALGLSDPTIADPIATLFETTLFYVTGTDAVGCQATDSILITVDNDLNCLALRTIFSPNGDNVNDVWSIDCVSLYDNEVRVFNRWGQLVFMAENYTNDWNGISITGEALPEDSYFYVVKITTPGREHVLRGSVALVR